MAFRHVLPALATAPSFRPTIPTKHSVACVVRLAINWHHMRHAMLYHMATPYPCTGKTNPLGCSGKSNFSVVGCRAGSGADAQYH
jgi:hypothetical protein